MLHSNFIKNLVISTQEPVYRDSSLGKLEEQVMVDSLCVPLQEGFDSNSQRGFSVGINYLSTFAFKQSVVAGMPFTDCTAMATPLASVVGINNFKSNVFIEASAFEQEPKRVEGNSHDFFVEFPSFRGKAFEVFNGNIRIKFKSHVSNISNYFTEPILDKIVFPCLEFSEASCCPTASFVSEGLEFFFSLKNLFTFSPNIFSEVCLFEDFSDWRENRNSEAFGVDVNTENILSLWQNSFFFVEISNYFKFGGKSIGFTSPTVFNEGAVSLIVTILFDWYRQSLSRVHSKPHEKSIFCFKCIAVPRNIEFNSNSFEFSSFNFNDISFNITDNLRTKRGVFFAC